MPLNSTIGQVIDKGVIDLSAINSSNDERSDDGSIVDSRAMRKGSIIKLPVIDVFDDWTATRNGIGFVYGITECIEDRCEVTGKFA